MSFAKLPHNVLISVLQYCEVEDVLCLERVCCSVREATAERSVWFAQLQKLDQPCAPNLLNEDVRRLSITHLRHTVVAAVRTCASWTRGARSRIKLDLDLTIPFSLVDSSESERLENGASPRFSPCGRFLFLQCGQRQLRIFDSLYLYFNDIEIKPAPGEDLSFFYVKIYEVGQDEAGTLILACTMWHTGINDGSRSLYKVYRVVESRNPMRLLMREIFRSEKPDSIHPPNSICLTPRYAVFYGDEDFMLIKHCEIDDVVRQDSIIVTADDTMQSSQPQSRPKTLGIAVTGDHLLLVNSQGMLLVVFLPDASVVTESGASAQSLMMLKRLLSHCFKFSFHIAVESSLIACYENPISKRVTLCLLIQNTDKEIAYMAEAQVDLSTAGDPVVEEHHNLGPFPHITPYIGIAKKVTTSCRFFLGGFARPCDRRPDGLYIVSRNRRGGFAAGKLDLDLASAHVPLSVGSRGPYMLDSYLAMDRFSNTIAFVRRGGVDIYVPKLD